MWICCRNLSLVSSVYHLTQSKTHRCLWWNFSSWQICLPYCIKILPLFSTTAFYNSSLYFKSDLTLIPCSLSKPSRKFPYFYECKKPALHEQWHGHSTQFERRWTHMQQTAQSHCVYWKEQWILLHVDWLIISVLLKFMIGLTFSCLTWK